MNPLPEKTLPDERTGQGDNSEMAMNVLFVCTANISRSFLAEKIFQHEARLAGLQSVSAASAGIYAYPGSSPDPVMVEYLLKIGLTGDDHQSRQLSEKDIERSHLILVMEKSHQTWIQDIIPRASWKIELLSRFVAQDRFADDIADPFGRSSYHYRLAQSQITLAVRNLIKMLLFLQPLSDSTAGEILRRIRGE